jgi:hypothetical protein
LKTWQNQTSTYLDRLRSALEHLDAPLPYSPSIPGGPMETAPTVLQSTIHRSVTFYNFSAWNRARETTQALVRLWSEGYLSPGAALSRLLFEIWGVSRLMSNGLRHFLNSKDVDSLSKTVDKLFEGVRSEVLLPWGSPASEKPIHVLDAVRALQQVYPEAMRTYEDLCESAHANQPRFMEWWFIGKAGDNWSNETVQKRGHILLSKTVGAVELAVSGIVTEVEEGMKLCGQIY